MVPRRGRQGVTPEFRRLAMASRSSNLIPEKPWRSVLMRTSIAALAAVDGSVWPASSRREPNIPALRNLHGKQNFVLS